MAASSTNLEAELRAFIGNELVAGGGQKKFGDEEDLLESGILDSMAVVQLVSHVEEQYGIEVLAGEIVAENIGSVRRIADFIRRKSAG
jgi:acyl carrier protein